MSEPSTPPKELFVHRYDPFDGRWASRYWYNNWIQEVIYYAESRLRSAIIGIRQQEQSKQVYLQQFLRGELHFFMSYIGLAASASICLDIPIVLRSLAVSFGAQAQLDTCLAFDLDFIALLEVGTRPTDPYHIVPKYINVWWKGTLTSKKLGIISEQTLDDALMFHRDELKKTREKEDKDKDSPIALADTTADHVASNPRNPTTGFGGLLDHAKSFVDGVYTSADAERAMSIRRSAAFFMLHEASVSTDLDKPPGKKTQKLAIDKNRKDETQTIVLGDITDVDMNNQDRTQTNVLGNTKWVSGNPLTVKQVLGILQHTKTSYHEGYIHNLREGKFVGEYSEYESISSSPPTLTAKTTSGSILTTESPSVNEVPPPTNLHFPEAFDKARFRLPDWPLIDDGDVSSVSTRLELKRSTSHALEQVQHGETQDHKMDIDLETSPLMDPKGDTSGGPIPRRRPLAAEFAAIPTYTPRTQDDGSSTILPPPHSQVLGIVDPIKTLGTEIATLVPHPPLANDTMPSSIPVSRARRPRPSAADFISSISSPSPDVTSRVVCPSTADLASMISSPISGANPPTDVELPKNTTEDILRPLPKRIRPSVADFSAIQMKPSVPSLATPSTTQARPPRPSAADFASTFSTVPVIHGSHAPENLSQPKKIGENTSQAIPTPRRRPLAAEFAASTIPKSQTPFTPPSAADVLSLIPPTLPTSPTLPPHPSPPAISANNAPATIFETGPPQSILADSRPSAVNAISSVPSSTQDNDAMDLSGLTDGEDVGNEGDGDDEDDGTFDDEDDEGESDEDSNEDGDSGEEDDEEDDEEGDEEDDAEDNGEDDSQLSLMPVDVPDVSQSMSLGFFEESSDDSM